MTWSLRWVSDVGRSLVGLSPLPVGSSLTPELSYILGLPGSGRKSVNIGKLHTHVGDPKRSLLRVWYKETCNTGGLFQTSVVDVTYPLSGMKSLFPQMSLACCWSTALSCQPPW